MGKTNKRATKNSPDSSIRMGGRFNGWKLVNKSPVTLKAKPLTPGDDVHYTLVVVDPMSGEGKGRIYALYDEGGSFTGERVIRPRTGWSRQLDSATKWANRSIGIQSNPKKKASKKKVAKKKVTKKKAAKRNPTRGGGWTKGQRWPFRGEFTMSEVTTKLFDINVESEQTGSTRRVPAKADVYEFMGRIVFVDPADTSGNLTQLGDGVFLPLDRGWLMSITGKGVLIAGVIYPGGKRKHEFISLKDPRIKKRAWINKFRSARKIRGEIYNKFYAVRISIALEYLLPGETVFSSGDKGELETPVFASEKDALSFISSLKKATVSISADSRSRLRYKWVDRGGQRRGNPKMKKEAERAKRKSNPKKSGGFTAAQNKKLRLGWAKAQPGFMISETVLSKPVRALALYKKGSKWGSGVIDSSGQLIRMVEVFKHSSAFAAAKSAENIVLEKPKKKATKKKVAKKKVAKKKVAKKKVARKKTPEWQLLINRCRKLWDHYCERPSKKRLKPVLEHLEKMKASTSKKVADERKSCLRIANKEARSLKMK